MKSVFLTCALLSCAAVVSAQALPPQPRQCSIPDVNAAMLGIIDAWKTGYNEANPDKVAALYADDATYLTQHFVTGIVHGRAAIRAYVKKGTDAKYKIDSLKMLSSDCSNDSAYAITRYESTNAGQKAVGVNLVVLKRFGREWLIVAHESAVPDPSTAIQKLDIAPR